MSLLKISTYGLVMVADDLQYRPTNDIEREVCGFFLKLEYGALITIIASHLLQPINENRYLFNDLRYHCSQVPLAESRVKPRPPEFPCLAFSTEDIDA